jgi:hypothetical protein
MDSQVLSKVNGTDPWKKNYLFAAAAAAEEMDSYYYCSKIEVVEGRIEVVVDE